MIRLAQDYNWAWCFPPLLWKELGGLARGEGRSLGHMSAQQVWWVPQEVTDLSRPGRRLPRVEAWQGQGGVSGGSQLEEVLTERCSKAHWTQILSFQPTWSPGRIDPARPPGWEGLTIQRPPFVGHRMLSEPESADPPGCGHRRQGHLLRWRGLPISLLPVLWGSGRGSLGDFLSIQGVGLAWSVGWWHQGPALAKCGFVPDMELQRRHDPM